MWRQGDHLVSFYDGGDHRAGTGYRLNLRLEQQQRRRTCGNASSACISPTSTIFLALHNV